MTDRQIDTERFHVGTNQIVNEEGNHAQAVLSIMSRTLGDMLSILNSWDKHATYQTFYQALLCNAVG